MSTGDVSNGTQPGTGAACRDREVGGVGRGATPGRWVGRVRSRRGRGTYGRTSEGLDSYHGTHYSTLERGERDPPAAHYGEYHVT